MWLADRGIGKPGGRSVTPTETAPMHFWTSRRAIQCHSFSASGAGAGCVSPEQQQHGPQLSPQAQWHFRSALIGGAPVDLASVGVGAAGAGSPMMPTKWPARAVITARIFQRANMGAAQARVPNAFP